MTNFVRKNLLVVTATFKPVNGATPPPTPTNAEAIVQYHDTGGALRTDNVPMTYDSVSAAWKGIWDSSAAGPGAVEWMVHCWGGLQSAAEGTFYIEANKANLTT